ncbi:short-subunit dehydrogenase [Nocardia kruczakiae]|uniref:Short-subunit dehydrogenase n=1 Tax=Nocardia kruczakiae TaxID=261477 RepID=A0ABU1XQZ7_9NOCA|nr:SDR family NAD(P)-dependent oxidoreductase [Nocardia kruczakiae]MDR7172986.1 short-subunit dehydrogenase [Nocardia kruczakiae]
MPTTRTAVITGASSGIGRATAATLSAKGYRVIGTSRNPDMMSDTARVPGIDYRPLDLTDHDSIQQFASALDSVAVLINNAGESQVGPLAEIPDEALTRLFQLNVLGPIALPRAVLPGMRARGTGRVVMVGSMLASFPLPYRSSYVATKSALRGFATAARFEESPYGVWLTTVEPGQVDSGLRERRTKYLSSGSPHTPEFERFMAELDRRQGEGIAPDKVARTILAAVSARRPRPLYAVGSHAPVVFALRRTLPGGLMERVTARAYGLRR